MSFDIFVLKFLFEFLIISLSDPFISVTIATYILVWLQRLNFVYKQELVKKNRVEILMSFFPYSRQHTRVDVYNKIYSVYK